MTDRLAPDGPAATAPAPDTPAPAPAPNASGPITEPVSTDARPEQLPPGTRVTRYLVVECIGSGGMGVVYKAYDPELDRRVALKILQIGAREDPQEARVRLLREAQALARVSHPNVVSVYDMGTYEGSVFVAMEYLEGTNLGTWLQGRPRALTEILDVFVKAGRGLEAAHQAGLVHRDFKPSNVLVGAQGDVHVLDFGLARATHAVPGGATLGEHSEERARSVKAPPLSEAAATRWTESTGEHGSKRSLLATPLTQVGMVVGTPAYMSPEQFMGSETDARSDQFSFCVALYEAVYRNRPFVGATLESLRNRVLAGEICPAPRDRGVPDWLRRVLTRGMAPERRDRWPSMGALLTRLNRDPTSRTRRRVAVWALASIGVAVLGTVVGYGYRHRCAFLPDALGQTWEAEQRTTLSQHFEAADLPLAAATLPKVLAGLDRYAESFRRSRVQACQQVRWDPQVQARDERRMQTCFDHREKAFNALTHALSQPALSNRSITRAVTAVGTLPPVETCADLDALRAHADLPETPEAEASVAMLRRDLAEATTQQRLGNWPEALDAVKTLVPRAKTSGYAPIEAEILLRQGQLQERLGQFRESEQSLLAAVSRAAAGHDRQVHARAWADLVGVKLIRLGQVEDQTLVASAAEAALAYAGRPPHIEALLAINLGSAAWTQGAYDEAERQYRRAQGQAMKAGGPQDPQMASVRVGLANVALAQGHYDDAIALYHEALEIQQATLGPEHPVVATTLNNIGSVWSRQGDIDKALALHRQSLAIKEAALGPDDMRVAISLFNIAREYRRQNRWSEAEATYRRTHSIVAATLGAKHPTTAVIGGLLGGILEAQNRGDEAWSWLQPALEPCETPGQGPKQACPLVFWDAARNRWQRGSKRDADALAQRALSAFEAQPPSPRRNADLKDLRDWCAAHVL